MSALPVVAGRLPAERNAPTAPRLPASIGQAVAAAPSSPGSRAGPTRAAP
jgi:hypothetical protein